MSIALAARYSRALADLAFDPRNAVDPETLTGDLDRMLEQMAASQPLRDILASPAVDKKRKRAVIGKIGDTLGIHPLTRKFLFVVLDHGRASLLGAIRDGYRRAVDERRGIVPATVTSAVELTVDERQMFERRVAELTGRQPRCEFRVEPSILGGAILRIGSELYDGSLRGRLENLEAHLTRGA